MRVHSTCFEKRLGLINVPKEVPDTILTEEWAQRNHGQTLKRLNERGGMGILEMLDNIHKRGLSYRKETQKDVDELNELIKSHLV